MWLFLVLGLALEEKLHGAKCCKYFRSEGEHFKIKTRVFNQSAKFQFKFQTSEHYASNYTSK